MENICELYKRIMKYDMEVVDEIESLEQAKGVIKMMLEKYRIHCRQEIMYPIIVALRECSFRMIKESGGKKECTKNRYGSRTMEACEGYEFEEIKLSEIDVNKSVFAIRKKYYGKNIYLVLDE